jgi:hypothetical protein
MSTRVREAGKTHAHRQARERPQRVQGHVERVSPDGFVQLRFGKEAGEYLILHVPVTCRIHQAGAPFPLKDVQFCDSVSVSYHSHYRFDVPLAQEIELL